MDLVNGEGESSKPPLPPIMELAWGLRERGGRGPRRGLSLERVVAAGIKVALTEGIGALSMARVAAELGVGTMSLYRYVAAKDELLTLMVDTAIGSPPASVLDQMGWRAGLTAWAEGVRTTYRRHPWALRVPISAPPLGPNNISWLEAALRALAETPLPDARKLRTVTLISFFVRSEVTLDLDLMAARAGTADERPSAPDYGAMLAQLTDPLHFPALHRVIASGGFEGDKDPDAQFSYGLECILDGVEALIRKTSAARSRPARPARPSRT
jgi:AcrR family transcriptional regulator